MKQAILITAYKDVDHLCDLINYFPESSFEFYIHFDKKSKADLQPLLELRTQRTIFISRKYKVNWGGRNHLRAILLLAAAALKNNELVFFHLISGQDFPVKHPDYFLNDFDKEKDYLQTVPYPVKHLRNGARDWYELYNFYDLLDAKKYMSVIRFLRNLQLRFGFTRKLSTGFSTVFYGSTYWSLTRSTLQAVVAYTNTHPRFLRRMQHTFCSEEIYFPTVILNSPHASKIVNDNLRYIAWESGGKSGSPKFLDIRDFETINNSTKLFARKFGSPVSDALKKQFMTSHRDLNNV